jgi:YVTN family beta-propeller protein
VVVTLADPVSVRHVIPRRAFLQATDEALYVANQGASTLSIIDPTTFKTTATIATGSRPNEIAVVQPRPKHG